LGRIVRDDEGRFSSIVEEKDATEREKQIKEVNMSSYVFDAAELVAALDQLKNDNRQQEYYLTDCPGILQAQGKEVRALPILLPCEALSVNTVEDLAVVEAELRKMGH
jgi:bifunctional UDP-N-acetylglucosamine pyrophosphorylase/glucosamine-1-phosphate N-acetyltransferase/UDP-N-acetylglucosamine pyrophosphorylase